MFWKLQNKFFLKKQTRFYKQNIDQILVNKIQIRFYKQNIDHILFFENHGEKYRSGFSLKKKHEEKCRFDFSFEREKHGEKKCRSNFSFEKHGEKNFISKILRRDSTLDLGMFIN